MTRQKKKRGHMMREDYDYHKLYANSYKELYADGSACVVKYLMRFSGMDRETAVKSWFGSQTYREIVAKRLMNYPAFKAYMELLRERDESCADG